MLASSKLRKGECIVELVDRQSNSTVSVLVGHKRIVLSIDISWDGQFISAGSEDGTVIVWDVQSCSALVSLPHDTFCVGVEFDRSLDRLLSNVVESAVVWNWRSSEVLFTIIVNLANLVCARYNVDYACINHLVLEDSLMLCKYDANTGVEAEAGNVTLRSEVPSNRLPIQFPCYCVHRSSGVSALAWYDEILLFHDDEGSKFAIPVQGAIVRFAFNTDGTNLATARNYDGYVHIDIWNLDLSNSSFSLINNLSTVGSICNVNFSPDGSEIACGLYGSYHEHCIFSLETMDIVHEAEPEGKRGPCFVQYFPTMTILL